MIDKCGQSGKIGLEQNGLFDFCKTYKTEKSRAARIDSPAISGKSASLCAYSETLPRLATELFIFSISDSAFETKSP